MKDTLQDKADAREYLDMGANLLGNETTILEDLRTAADNCLHRLWEHMGKHATLTQELQRVKIPNATAATNVLLDIQERDAEQIMVQIEGMLQDPPPTQKKNCSARHN